MTPSLKRPWQRRLLRSLVLFVGVPYVAVMAMMVGCQRWLIYGPTCVDRLPAAKASTPERRVHDIELTTTDGLVLHGWRFTAPKETDHPRRCVIYFPGNAGCRRDRLSDCADFTRLGCDVLLFDYRGYGDNPGSPSEAALARDAKSLWQHATGPWGYAPSEIVLFGESLGGGVATRLAADCAQAGEPVAALILNSTFASLAETAAWHYPAFPVQFLVWDRFASVERLPFVNCPVLHFHGTADTIVPYSHGQRLFAAAPPHAASRFVTIPGGQHNFISMHDMHDAVSQLFDELAATQAD